MPWEDLITPFGDALYSRLKERGLTVRAFAQLAGISIAFLSRIANRKAPPPLDRIEGWADTLVLTGEEREYFLDLAALEVVPTRARRLFEPWRPGFRAIQRAIDRQCVEDGRAYPFPGILGYADEPPAAGTPDSRSPARQRAAESGVAYDALRKKRKPKGDAKP